MTADGLIRTGPSDTSPRAYLGSMFSAEAEVATIERRLADGAAAAEAIKADPHYEPVTSEQAERLSRIVVETLSDGPPIASVRNLSVPFLSPAEVLADAPESVRWVARLVAAGAISELDGPPKASGKTTLALALAEAVTTGARFLGQPTEAGPVVYVSEQGPATLRASLTRAGLAVSDRLRLVLWRDVRAVPWPTLVAAVVAECQRIGAVLAVFDTLSQFAGLTGDSENDSGAAMAALAPLQAAAADGLAVLICRHTRKGPGVVGESGRGSSAFTGGVDTVIDLRRKDGGTRPNVRVLSVLSRFELDPTLVVELTDTGYVALGDLAALELAETTAAVVDHLPASTSAGLTEAELVDVTGAARTTVRHAVADLTARGEAEKVGAGKRNDPYRFRLTDSGKVSDQPTPPKGGGSAVVRNFPDLSVADDYPDSARWTDA